jgi:hypothetical protein
LTDVSEVLAASRILIAVMMKAASTSEMLINFYQTTCCYNSEDSHLHFCCHKNLKHFLSTFIDERKIKEKDITV